MKIQSLELHEQWRTRFFELVGIQTIFAIEEILENANCINSLLNLGLFPFWRLIFGFYVFKVRIADSGFGVEMASLSRGKEEERSAM